MKKALQFILFLIPAAYSGDVLSQTLTIGTGAYTGTNVYGPANTSTTSTSSGRYAYIYPLSLLKGIKHGDTITSIEFYRNGGTSLSGSPNMKIYMRNTLKTDYGTGSINWVNATGALGMKKVFDNNPVIEVGATPGFRMFKLSTPYVYDTLFGKNLEILTEYVQSTAQSDNIFWNFDDAFFVPGYASNQAKFWRGLGTPPDTTNQSSDRHPYIRINFPRYNTDLMVTKVYSLGKLPVPLGNPDTVRAWIKNVGKLNAVNVKVYIISKGANKLIDSAYISLPASQEKLFSFPPLAASNKGLDTIEIRVALDDNAVNNSSHCLRMATENVYSYRDISLPPDPGGIGFNGTTGDFVAKFYSNQSKHINQVTVNFGLAGTQFRLGIWKADGRNGRPGTNVWTSGTLTSSLSFITPVNPPVQVNGSFYVGVRQIGTNNVAFGYQTEDPVRPGTFFFAEPMGDTNWVDFSPDAPFKFLIEPRLQADNDVSPLSYDYPKDTINYFTMKTMAPKARIYNLGVNNQLTPFNITCNVKQFASLIYTSTVKDTISSGQTHKIVFDSSLLPPIPGEYTVEIITKLPGDQVSDNDTLRSKFVVARYKDVGINTVFDPSNETNYELNVDTVYPVARVNNFGADRQGPFSVRARIYDSTKTLVYTDTKVITLPGINNTLMSFKAFPCNKLGAYDFEVFTELPGDLDRKNDTVRRHFYVVKSNDVGVDTIMIPAKNAILVPGSTAINPKAVVSNYGELNQVIPFTVVCEILKDGVNVYTDSVSITSYVGSPETLSFTKSFKPDIKGYYSVRVYSKLPEDQLRPNDTLEQLFAVGVPDDVYPLELISPADSASLEFSYTYRPKVSVFNRGFLPQNTPFDVHIEISTSGVPVYSNMRSLTLDSGSTALVVFDSTLKPLSMADHKVLVYTSLSRDFVKANDTLRGIYHIIKTHDVAVTAITSEDSIDLNTEVLFPAATIENLGRVAETVSFPVFCTITNPQGTIVYSSMTDSSIGLSESKTILFADPFTGKVVGPHRIRIYTDMPGDQLADNDTFTSLVHVVNRNDAAPIAMIYPAHTASIKSNIGLLAPKGRIYNWGLNRQDQVNTTLEIRNSSLDLVYSNMVSTALEPLQTKDVVFDSTFDPSAPGNYIATLYTQINNDQRTQNDTITTSFVITDNSDLPGIVSENSVMVYPNPANDQVLVMSIQAGISNVKITDMTGKTQLYQHAEGSQNVSCNVSALASGLYTVGVTLENKQLIRLRINVIH